MSGKKCVDVQSGPYLYPKRERSTKICDCFLAYPKETILVSAAHCNNICKVIIYQIKNKDKRL